MVHRGHKFAHQHVEAAIAAQRDDLARAIEGLDPVGLTERRSDGGVVEGADNPLRSALPDPVAGPQRVEAGVEDEYRVAFGEITDRSRYRLRMDAILAACQIGLLVQLLIPFRTLSGHLVPKARIALRRNPVEQRFEGRQSRADDAEHCWGAPAEDLLPFVDLDDGPFAWQEFGIRIVGADHQ